MKFTNMTRLKKVTLGTMFLIIFSITCYVLIVGVKNTGKTVSFSEINDEKFFKYEDNNVQTKIDNSVEVQEKSDSQLAVEEKQSAFSITDDSTLLGGEGFFYIEDGVLYRNKLRDEVVVEYGQKIAEMGSSVLWVSALQDDKTILFTVISEIAKNPFDNELWSINKDSGTAQRIYEDIYYAQISPDGELFVVSQFGTGELHIINRNGDLLDKIGIHGGYATFSNQGNQLAYHKLADNVSSSDFNGLLEMSQGITIYDIETQKEYSITSYPGDYNPLGFSSNGAELYFISGGDRDEDGLESLWSVNVHNGDNPIRLSAPFVSVHVNSNNAIWSTTRDSIVSEVAGAISFIHISSDGKSAQTYDLGEGIAPRWKVQDKVIEFKGPDGWKEIDITSFLDN